MTKENKINSVMLVIQQAIILDINANITPASKELIKNQIEKLWDSAESAGEEIGFKRASEIAYDVISRQGENSEGVLGSDGMCID